MAAPTISTRTPSVSATNVYLNQLIYITFDQSMTSSTLNDNTIVLYRTSDYEIMDKTISYNSTTFRVTLTPDVIFDNNTTYNAVVVGVNQSTTCVKNASSESLATSATWYFTTGTSIYEAPEDTVTETQPDTDVAEPPVAKVLEPKTVTDFAIVSTYPENYDANLGTIQGDSATVYWGMGSPSGISVTFNRLLASGSAVAQSWLTISAEAVDGDPDVTTAEPMGNVYNSSGTTLRWMPSSSALAYTWRVNNEITVTVSEDVRDYEGNTLGNDYEFMFTTAYFPLYCTLKKIRAVIGPFLRDVNDDVICRNIYLNSVEAYNIANVVYDQSEWDEDSPTFAAKMWTCCKTQYDLLYAKLLDLSQGGPGQLKRLGDLTVQDVGDINSGIKGAVQKALDCMNAWLKQLLGKSRRAKVKAVIKGVSATTTPPMRGVRTWSAPAGGGIGANQRGERIAKSPGAYDDWS